MTKRILAGFTEFARMLDARDGGVRESCLETAHSYYKFPQRLVVS